MTILAEDTPMVPASEPEGDEAQRLIEQGKTYLRKGRYKNAETAFEESLRLRHETLGPEHLETAESHYYLAVVLWKTEQLENAEKHLFHSLKTRHQLLGESHPDVARSLASLANIAILRDDYAEAQRLTVKALRAMDVKLERSDKAQAVVLGALGTACYYQQKYDEAEKCLERALTLCEQSVENEADDEAVLLNNLANVYNSQGRYADAEVLYRKALHLLEELAEGIHPENDAAYLNLANVCSKQSKHAETVSICRNILPRFEKTRGATNDKTVTCLVLLSEALLCEKHFSDAEPLVLRLIAHAETTHGLEHPLVARYLFDLGVLRYNQNRLEESVTLHKRALFIREKVLGKKHEATVQSYRELTALYGIIEKQLLSQKAAFGV